MGKKAGKKPEVEMSDFNRDIEGGRCDHPKMATRWWPLTMTPMLIMMIFLLPILRGANDPSRGTSSFRSPSRSSSYAPVSSHDLNSGGKRGSIRERSKVRRLLTLQLLKLPSQRTLADRFARSDAAMCGRGSCCCWG